MEEGTDQDANVIESSRCYNRKTTCLEIIRSESYHILSALRLHINNNSGYSSTSNFVPILGSDSSSTRNYELNLIRKFKSLSSINLTYNDDVITSNQIRPFLDVFKILDSRNGDIIIISLETLTKLAKYDLLRFSDEEGFDMSNKIFEDTLLLLSTAIESKEDLVVVKIINCLEALLTWKNGNLINNDNIFKMLKVFISLITWSIRNFTVRRTVQDKLVDVLFSCLGGSADISDVSNFSEIRQRKKYIFIFILLLATQTSRTNKLSFYAEDSYLSLDDKKSLSVLRSTIAPITQSMSAYPNSFNDFLDEYNKIGFSSFNRAVEFTPLDYENSHAIIAMFQTHFFHSIYRICFKEYIEAYSDVFRAFWNLYGRARTYLKSQIEVFLKHILGTLSNFFNSKSMTKPEIIEIYMEFIMNICSDHQFLFEIYVNYDCDGRCANIFEILLKALISCITIVNEADTANTLQQSKVKRGSGRTASKKKANSALQYKATISINDGNTPFSFEPMALVCLQNILRFLIDDVPQDQGRGKGKKEFDIIHRKEWKDKLISAAKIFNETEVGGDWITSIKALKLIPDKHTPKDIAMFLKHVPELDLKLVGEYLGTHKDPEFMDEVRTNFIKLHNFSGLPIVMAIRIFLSSFRLPGESQQIERIIETFASVYFESQPLVDVDNPEVKDKKSAPRWIILEEKYWNLNFTTHDIFSSIIKNDSRYDAKLNEVTNDFSFERYFISSEISSLMVNEKFNHICKLLKESKLSDKESITSDEDSKKQKAPSESHICRFGFTYIENVDVIFVLSYSIIMLNTDLHNQQIKNKMRLEDFVRNNKGINNGKNLPFEFLEDIYKSIKHHEIKLHKNTDISEHSSYEEHFWTDHVLERQNILGKYYVNIKCESLTIKKYMIDTFHQLNFVKSLSVSFSNAKTVDELKQYVRIFWLLIRAALMFQRYELINIIFQLQDIDVTYNLSYKCQLSIPFILNLVATASDFFDHVSWTKVLDIVLGLYCLNLIPMSFAALDLDPRIYNGASKNLSDSVIAPSIRFKRNTDIKKASSWLLGLTNLIPFNRVANIYDDTTAEFDNGVEKPNPEGNQAFLFLFDVQSGTEFILENKYFDASILRKNFSPISSAEDEEAINEVTIALANDVDKEELLPQVLSYMNLRLAFLNVYKLDSLFVGSIASATIDSFLNFLKVVIRRIFSVRKGLEKVVNEDIQNQPQSARSKDIINNMGAILDPMPTVLDAFKYKIESIFNLGIFIRVATVILNDAKHISYIDGADDPFVTKRRLVLIYLIKSFDKLCKAFIVDEAKAQLPSVNNILKTFGLLVKDEECNFIETDEKHGPLLDIGNFADYNFKNNEILASHVCVTLLRMVLWLAENSESDLNSSRSADLEEGFSYRYVDNDDGSQYISIVEWNELSLTLSAWLLHLLISFETKVLMAHLDPISKCLYNLASLQCISRSKYLVSVILCGLQRIINPKLPFDVLNKESVNNYSANCSYGSIVTLLIRRSRFLNPNNAEIAKLVSQVLLSITLLSKPVNIDSDTKRNWNENRMALQLLIEFKTFFTENDEYIWLLSLHCLSIIFSIGPKQLSSEAIKGLNRLLLQDSYPDGNCSKIIQIVRIFDYILAPMLTSNFQYPLSRDKLTTPVENFNVSQGESNDSVSCDWFIHNPFTLESRDSTPEISWMSFIITKYLASYSSKDPDDLASRKASATNLICHTILAKLPLLISEELNYVPQNIVKLGGTNLECVLYLSEEDKCSKGCVKRFITVTQYILNVIIPSDGEIHVELSRDTYLESLRNFILVLMTTPELKTAPETCINHFHNDVELKDCLEIVKDLVDVGNASPGEYALSSLLAHTFSISDSLKDLFLDTLKVVFPSVNCSN